MSEQPKETDRQCGRCGSSVEFTTCETCDGDGWTYPGQLHEEDPLWYDEDDDEPCHVCGGAGGWWWCISSEEWCKANPLPGRESVVRGTIEYFEVSP